MTMLTMKRIVRTAAFACAAVALPACGEPDPAGAVVAATPAAEPRPLHPVTIHKPSGPPRVLLGVEGPDGKPLTAACSTCHATRSPNPANRAADLDEFHQGLQFVHGDSSCYSCHDERDYDALKLADGRRVEYADVMTLCSQCHGPQANDYAHGAHGGMTGYWDLTRGPRERNNCVDCHDPHAPKFPAMVPTFKPKDRFLDPPSAPHGSPGRARSTEGTR